MRVALLHLSSLEEFASAEASLPDADLYLCSALAVERAPKNLPLLPAVAQDSMSRLSQLAATTKKPLLLPLSTYSKQTGGPMWLVLHAGSVSPLESRVQVGEQGVQRVSASISLPKLGTLSLFFFLGAQVGIEAEHLFFDDLAEETRAADLVLVSTSLPWWNGFELGLNRVLAACAKTLKKNIVLMNALGCEDGVLYHGERVFFSPEGTIYTLDRIFSRKHVLCDTSRLGTLPEPVSSPWETLWRALVFGMRSFVHASGLHHVYIGLSGGIDSALVFVIACEALGKEYVHPVFMPSRYTTEASWRDAQDLADRFDCPLVILPIDDLLASFRTVLEPVLAPKSTPDTTFENLQARIRAVLLCALANRASALIVNTSNKSEVAMGYSTLYGDTIGAFSVLGDVLKTEVYALATWHKGRFQRHMPDSFLTKAPSAELRENQKDTDSLPPYAQLDPIVDALLQGNMPQCEQKELAQRVVLAEFKRRQEPMVLAVSRSPFGHTWQIPVAFGLPRA